MKISTIRMPFVRLLLGGFFIVIGGDKVIEPYQNFMYVVQAYQIFPEFLTEFVARVFPWIELFLGIFLVLGLYLKWTLWAFLLMMSSFILIISQALIRKLPIDSCGCFGGLFSSDIHHTLLMDIGLWIIVFGLLRSINETSNYSLDRYFSKN